MRTSSVVLPLCLVVLTLCNGFATGQHYKGCKVYRLDVKTQKQNDFLSQAQRSFSNVTFWTNINGPKVPVDVMVCQQDTEGFLQELENNGIQWKITIDDVQRLVSQQMRPKLRSAHAFSWDDYANLPQINAWLRSLEKTHPSVQVISGGVSSEGREILGVKIYNGKGKRAVMLEGGMHAREWIGPATVTFILNEILNGVDENWQMMAKKYNWYIFPVVNPDGYTFSHTRGNRFWRKTRTPIKMPHGEVCYGVDMNRNWDSHWSEFGVSDAPCEETYGGSGPFSDPSSSSLSNFIKTIGKQLDVYLAFHAYSQYLLLPYGHTTKHLDNYNDVVKIGKAAVKALASRNGTKYVVGNVAEVIYPASGGSGDWVKQEFNTPIVLTYELQDTGEYGFLLPPERIIPNCLEVMDSLLAIFENGRKLGVI